MNKLGIEKIVEELKGLGYFEKSYGFLSSIGLKIIKSRPPDYSNIQGFIKAPDNSPYKNGIFRFEIRFPHDYPLSRPKLYIKTPIFHTEYHIDNGECCISFLNNWNSRNNLIQILSVLYEFFVYQTYNGYTGHATALFRDKKILEFNEKCQEYVKKYNENENLKSFKKEDFLFQEEEYNGAKNGLSLFEVIIVNIQNTNSRLLNVNRSLLNEPVKKLIEQYFGIRDDFALIVGQKVYDSSIKLGECLTSPIIFLIPLLYEFSSYIKETKI